MELITPNLHVVLVHYPIALLVVGTLIELFSFMWRRHSFRGAGRWMILLGALLSIPTALSGVYALYDVATGHNPQHSVGPWNQVKSSLTTAQWDTLERHAWLQGASTVLAVIAVITWIGCSDRWRTRLHFPLLLLLLISVGLTAAGAWLGGETVYRQGTGVVLDQTPSTLPQSDAIPSTSTTQAGTTASRMTRYIQPIQMHVIMAGMTVAVALAAIGLSIRKITQGPPITHMEHIASALGSAPTIVGGEGPDTLIEPQDFGSPRVPSGRFWMLAFLLALLTAGGGYVILALKSNTWHANELWESVIAENMRQQNYRQIVHVIAGGSIAVLALILAMLARWAPNYKWLLAFFSLLLLLIIASQVWFGILLLYDTPAGPLTGFN